MTMIGRAVDGLPLAASMQDDEQVRTKEGPWSITYIV